MGNKKKKPAQKTRPTAVECIEETFSNTPDKTTTDNNTSITSSFPESNANKDSAVLSDSTPPKPFTANTQIKNKHKKKRKRPTAIDCIEEKTTVECIEETSSNTPDKATTDNNTSPKTSSFLKSNANKDSVAASDSTPHKPFTANTQIKDKHNEKRKRPTAIDCIEEKTTEDVTSERSRKRSKTDNKEQNEVPSSAEPATQTIPKFTQLNQQKSEQVKEENTDGKVPEGENNEIPTEEFYSGPFLGYLDFDSYSNTLLPAVVNFLKVTKQLPSTKDEYDFYQSYSSFMTFSKNQGQRVLQLIGKMFKHHHVYQAWNTIPTNSVTGIEEQTDAVVEANDTLLERVDKILDMLKQEHDRPEKLAIQQKPSKDVLVAAWNTNNSSQQNKPIRLLHSKNILRPQLRWKTKPDNTSTPFIPLIRYKPNAKVPLQEEYNNLLNSNDEDLTCFLKSARGDNIEYPHPYQYELDHFEPAEWQFQIGLKREPFEVQDTPLTIIDKPEQLPNLISKLSECREIAVDLEAHSYRSFLGFTCLMQLSTRKEDFIVDTLALRTDLHVLNKVFTDPSILKVLHGAANDIKWLQRDLGVYIVNMFDSYHAAKQLTLPRCSLSYLLQRYCDVTPDKQYQLADWRIRPLPEVMLKYAREDTHYLLYIYDCLRYELLAQGLHALETVYRNSCLECQARFTKPISTEESYLDVYDKIRITLKPQQKQCLKLIYEWRDRTSRSEDESTAFVLPNHMMFKIAELLPGDSEGILACCNPPPPLIRLHVQEIHLLVEKARHYNPLLDLNTTAPDEEYTPDFLDAKHQEAVESIFTPKATPASRIKERKSIFYIPRTGPDVVIKQDTDNSDLVSLKSESGSISASTTSIQFFDSSYIKNEITDAVQSVKDSMTAPFKLFMSKIEELRKEEDKIVKEEAVSYPIADIIPKPEEQLTEEINVIVFKDKNKRSAPSDEAKVCELRTTSKKKSKNVGDIKPFSYEEITMSKISQNETVKPRASGDMLNKDEDSKAKQIRQRTNMKSGNRSGFQNFLKKKFKR